MNNMLIMFICVLIGSLIYGRMSYAGDACSAKKAASFGGIVAVSMIVICAIVGALQQWVIAPMGLKSLYYVAFAIATLVVFLIASCVVKAYKPILPLAAVVCVLLGVLVGRAESFLYIFLNGAVTGACYLIAVVLMAGVNDRIRFSKIPGCLKGVPIGVVTAGLMAIAFMGISGLH